MFFKEFGWTIDDCLNLTVNQILEISQTYLQIQNIQHPSQNKKKQNIISQPDEKDKNLTLNNRVKILVEKIGRQLTAEEVENLI